MEINKALEPIGIPVCHPPYSGSEDTFVTYKFIGHRSAIYAEGQETETGVAFSVDLYTNRSGVDTQEILKNIKTLLNGTGYICTVDMETFEKDTKILHYSLTATREDAVYV